MSLALGSIKNNIWNTVTVTGLSLVSLGMYFVWKKYNKDNENTPSDNQSENIIENNQANETPKEEILSEVSSLLDSSQVSETIHSLNQQGVLDETKLYNLLSLISENTLMSLVMACDTLREEYDLGKREFKIKELQEKNFSIDQFKQSIYEMIYQKNAQTFLTMKVPQKDYILSLNHYLKVQPNKKIKKRFEAMEKVLAHFNKSENIELNINFPDEIRNNFLKIITNTFYHTLKKVTFRLKEDVFDERIALTQEQLREKIDKYYAKNLHGVRKRIFHFFKIKDTELRPVSLVRVFVFTLPKSDPVRQKYEYYSGVLNIIEENLRKRIIAEEFVDKTNQHYIDDIQDEILNLERLTKNTIDYKMLEN